MTDEYMTHTVTIVVNGNYQHGTQAPRASVTVAGDGSLDHMLDAFRAVLVAAGFDTLTASRLCMDES